MRALALTPHDQGRARMGLSRVTDPTSGRHRGGLRAQRCHRGVATSSAANSEVTPMPLVIVCPPGGDARRERQNRLVPPYPGHPIFRKETQRCSRDAALEQHGAKFFIGLKESNGWVSIPEARLAQTGAD